MKRRDFFTTVAAVGAASVIPSAVFADKTSKTKEQKTRSFSLTLTHNIQEKGKISRIWIPLPLLSSYQQITSEISNVGNYDEIYMPDFEVPSIYAKFSKENPSITTKFSITTTDRVTDFSKVNFNENEKLTPEISHFLSATTHIQTDGVVKEYANKITSNISGDLEKARAIYSWVCDNMTRDESVIGCGVGDARATLESGKLYGKCTDISSVFVALCRSAGIPAREVFGIRIGESRFSKAMGSGKDGLATITGAQHCRAEFYIKGYGWIPCDPGDVTKVRLAEKLTNEDSKVKMIKEYLFGNWEMCWCGYNYARDFILKPEPEEKPLNNLGYVYAEVDGNVQNYYDAKTFAYEYKSAERLG